MRHMRGIRGATRVNENTRDEILHATRELLGEMITANQIEADDIASVFFTATADLDAEFPAYVTRELDWADVPLLCAREMSVPHGMTSVIRILIHVNTEKTQAEIRHIYKGETARLRPDLFGEPDDDHNNEE